MNRKLNNYIDDFISQPGISPGDHKCARHLKAIIPSSTHIDKAVLDLIIDEIEFELLGGINFKDAFIDVATHNILEGDEITAPLPSVLTRIIVNYSKFLQFLSNKEGTPVSQIKKRIASKGIHRYLTSLGTLKLAPNEVVLATFDETSPNHDPFSNNTVSEIVNMLALNLDPFNAVGQLTVIKIRYNIPGSVKKHYPTFCDTGWDDKFHPSDAADPYGRTISTDPKLKNMPEIAHENLEISKVAVDIEKLRR